MKSAFKKFRMPLILSATAVVAFISGQLVGRADESVTSFEGIETLIVLNTSNAQISIPDKKTGGMVFLTKNTGYFNGRILSIDPAKFKIGGIKEFSATTQK
jgi:hypothetical protein